MRGLKIKVLDYSPTPSRGVIESNHLIKMQKDVAILKQKENKISKKLKLTQSENSQLLKIKQKTEENISKQKKLINNQIDKIIDIFVKLVREKSVYLDLGKEYEIKGEDYQYPPETPVDRNKQGENFELPTHLTSSCVILGHESVSERDLEEKSKKKELDATKKSIKSGRSKSKRDLSETKINGKKPRSQLSKSPNPKKLVGFIRNFQTSLREQVERVSSFQTIQSPKVRGRASKRVFLEIRKEERGRSKKPNRQKTKILIDVFK